MTDSTMKTLAVILAFASFFACSRNSAEKPERLLSEDEMVNVLYDMALLQAMQSGISAQLDSSRIDTKNYIYKKYRVDSLSLVQNQKYYAADIENYQKLHKKVTEKLTALKAPLDSLKKKGPKPGKKKLRSKRAIIPASK